MEKALLEDLVEALKGEGEVVAPRNVGGDLLYMPVERASEVDFSRAPLDNPKMYVFPVTEKILNFEEGRVTPIVKFDRRVLLGVRPCDVAAFQYLKRFFGDGNGGNRFRDPYVMEKMERLTVVAFNCPRPGDHCFCSAMGTGPVATSGFDLSLSDLGGAYLLEAGSEVGERIARDLSLPPASSRELERREEVRRRCEAEMGIDFDAEGIEEKIGRWVNSVAESYGERCIVCGGCNFLCPTCSCFNMSDVERGASVTRERFWDSCILRGFTWLAGGTFGRDSIAARMKQRLMHKLCYAVERYGAPSCTGCGRCSRVCPSYIYMEDMIRDLLRGG